MKARLTFFSKYYFPLLFVGSIAATAQPSGGPYGPIRQFYDPPKNAVKIYYASPDGKSDASGETIGKPTTIESAFERVKTGDAIILRGGIYRTGNLKFNQGIVMQPYADEEPVFKGTYVATEWKNLGGGLWKTSWSFLFPAYADVWWNRDRFGRETPLHRFNNDIVFVDGKFLQAVGRESEVSENTFYIDYDAKQVYIGADPASHLIEITAFNFGVKRIIGECHGKASDKKGPIIRGITFTQYAYCAIEVEGKEPEGVSPESEHGKDVVGTTIENCTITFSSRVAAYFRGDHLTLRHCRVSDTSTEGVYIIASSDVLLEKNIFLRNNIENITGYYPAAVKIFNQSYRVTCRDNLVTDLPLSNGIWYDVGNVDGVFVNNWIENVGNRNRILDPNRTWPSDNGFFFEISKSVICAGNVFVNCDQGIFILNSSNAQIYNNTLVNSTVCIGRNDRSPATDGTFGWHSGTGPEVEKREGHIFANNLVTGDGTYRRPLMQVWQPDSMLIKFPKSQFKYFDNNVFVQYPHDNSQPFLFWSPVKNNEKIAVFYMLDDFKKECPNFLKNSLFFKENIQLFKSYELGNFQLLSSFSGSKIGMPLPKEISKFLSQPQLDGKYIGAYPPIP